MPEDVASVCSVAFLSVLVSKHVPGSWAPSAESVSRRNRYRRAGPTVVNSRSASSPAESSPPSRSPVRRVRFGRSEYHAGVRVPLVAALVGCRRGCPAGQHLLPEAGVGQELSVVATIKPQPGTRQILAVVKFAPGRSLAASAAAAPVVAVRW